jgi:hypothetical protein
MAKKTYIKVIDEQFIVPYEKGGGIIKFEAWECKDKIIKYNMAYIEPLANSKPRSDRYSDFLG